MKKLRASSSDLLWLDVCENWRTIKRIELLSTLTTTLFHIETETGTEEVYKCPSESPN